LRQEDRDRLMIGNALLRLAVAAAAGIAVRQVEIARSCPDCARPHGKPTVVGHPVEVSVSHSGDRIAVAVTGAGPVGVDVEQISRMQLAELDSMVLSPDEDPAELAFHTRWARKEAVLKATGEGLRRPMTTLTVTKDGLVGFGRPCFLRDLSPGAGYAAAVAVLTETDAEPALSEKDGSELLLG
jgi:4'-phosphopantetheinyl transferase